MWTLFVVIAGLAGPIVISGYETLDDCTEVGIEMTSNLQAPGETARFWCGDLPNGWRMRGR